MTTQSQPHPVGGDAQRIDVAAVRTRVERELEAAWRRRPNPIAPLEVIRAACGGLPGEALLSVGALACGTLDELTRYFGIAPKTLPERLRQPRLGRDDRERALRRVA